jgi:hypothetical protein
MKMEQWNREHTAVGFEATNDIAPVLLPDHSSGISVVINQQPVDNPLSVQCHVAL